jgi:polar amino acid transport system ATP-binding protein
MRGVEVPDLAVSPGRRNEPLLTIEGLTKRFGEKEVIRNVTFSVFPGETVCVVGPNGSGKTTLLRCLNLLTTPSIGTLTFRGRIVGRWSDERADVYMNVSEYRRRLGMVFQDFALFPHLDALNNVTLGPRRARHLPRPAAEAQGRALLAHVGLEAYVAARPSQMSGGQKQRVAIARALAMEPDLLLFDEPTSALDAAMVDEVLGTMKRLATEGMTMVVVTHEHAFARQAADRIVVMDGGVIIEEGSPTELFSSPRHDRTRQILRASR